MIRNIFKKILFIGLLSAYCFANCTAQIEEIVFSGQCKGHLKHGEFISKYSNGAIHWKITYKNNELNGRFYQYFPSGKLQKSGSYKNEKLHGKYIEYKVDGSKVVANFKYGVLNGNLYEYDKSEKITRQLKFYYGQLKYQKYF